MLFNPPAAMQAGGAAPIAERLRAILRDEIANGALASIAAAREVRSAHRRDLVLPEMTRRVAAELGGVLDAVLDLVAPPARTASATGQPTASGSPQAEPVPVLHARGSAGPGGTAGIRTTLQNDSAAPVESGFAWSDLVSDTGDRIAAGHLSLLPGRVRIPPGSSADLAIHLRVPLDVRPGLYRASLRATERVGSCALLVFLIDHDRVQEVSAAM